MKLKDIIKRRSRKTLKERIIAEMMIEPIKRELKEKPKEKLGDLIFGLICLICEGYKGDDSAFVEAEEMKKKINNLT